VVDWDQSRADGVTGADLITLFASIGRSRSPESPYRRLATGAWTDAERETWQTFAEALGIPAGAEHTIVVSRWLDAVWYAVRYDDRHLHTRWIESFVTPLLGDASMLRRTSTLQAGGRR
jgi:hypothetical protein